jgi:hypothetical protein
MWCDGSVWLGRGSAFCIPSGEFYVQRLVATEQRILGLEKALLSKSEPDQHVPRNFSGLWHNAQSVWGAVPSETSNFSMHSFH